MLMLLWSVYPYGDLSLKGKKNIYLSTLLRTTTFQRDRYFDDSWRYLGGRTEIHQNRYLVGAGVEDWHY